MHLGDDRRRGLDEGNDDGDDGGDDRDDVDRGDAGVEFVTAVTAGGSVKFLLAVLISPFSLIFCVFSY